MTLKVVPTGRLEDLRQMPRGVGVEVEGQVEGGQAISGCGSWKRSVIL